MPQTSQEELGKIWLPKKPLGSLTSRLVNFCERINASFILRGLRNPADFEFEKAIAHTNRSLSDIETVFLLTSTETSFISSSIVREVIQNHGDYAHLVPKAVTDS